MHLVFQRCLPLACLIAFAAPAWAQVVDRVIDGDTLVVSGIGTVRLIGVDTPETVDPRKLPQYFGKEAAAFLRRLTERKRVRLEYDVTRVDKYRRTLAYVFLSDGTFVNAEVIRQGYAHTYAQSPFKYLERFRALEREARMADRGLWAGGAALVPPTFSTQLPSASPANTVYITRTGDKYHRAGCRYLGRSQIPTALKDAIVHHLPCAECKPPLARSR